MLLKALRNGLGYIIVLLDFITRRRGISRTDEEQAISQAKMSGLSLYQLYACPFCVKTRRAIHKLNVDLEQRDIGKNTQFREQLESGGGRVKVPCLRIEEGGEVRWLYESNDIISFLQNKLV